MDFSEYSHGKAGRLEASRPAPRNWEEGTASNGDQMGDPTIIRGDRHQRCIGHGYRGSRPVVKGCAVVRRLQVLVLLVNSCERHVTINPARTN